MTDGRKEDWLIRTPAQIQFLGPSQSGKSYRILQLLAQQRAIFDRPFDRVIYAAPGLGHDDDGNDRDDKERSYLERLKAACRAGGISELLIASEVPRVQDVAAEKKRTLLILDDLLCFPRLTALTELSSLHAHHLDISCLYCLQNPFQKTSATDLQTLSRNATGRFIFFQTNDWRLYGTLNEKLFPDRKGFLADCLLAAQRLGLNYVFVNTAPFCPLPRRYICYTGLFAEDEAALAHQPGPRPVFFDLKQAPTPTLRRILGGGDRGRRKRRERARGDAARGEKE